MTLSINTDYLEDLGDPEPYLKSIADAGFSHINWCHQWDTDFLYSKWEIKQIKKWLIKYGLQFMELHASTGKEKCWTSSREYERLAGVELVQNRIEMTAELGGDVMVIHVPHESGNVSLRRSLDQIEPFARACEIHLALENGNFDVIEPLLLEYDSDYIGLCYDSGHSNLVKDGLSHLEALKDRLISVHLHDNDGDSDQHILPFSGTIDWQKLIQIMAGSSYNKPINVEVLMHHMGDMAESIFLKQAFKLGKQLSRMFSEARTDIRGRNSQNENRELPFPALEPVFAP